MCVQVSTCHNLHMEVSRLDSLLPSCGILGSNSGGKACIQALELSTGLSKAFLSTYCALDIILCVENLAMYPTDTIIKLIVGQGRKR